MRLRNSLPSIALVVAFGVALLGHAGRAIAQPLSGADQAPKTAIGGSLGVVSGGLYPTNRTPSDSLATDGGTHIGGRVDVALMPSLRLRFEESAMRWTVTRTSYARVPGGPSRSTSFSDGSVHARRTMLALGRQRCVCPVFTACGYSLVGVGVYTFDYAGSTVRRPGVLGVTGLDLPVSRRSAIQVEIQMHVVGVPYDGAVSGYDGLTFGLSAGWIYRF